MRDFLNAAPLCAHEARLTYPLVRMFDPAVTLQGWMCHVRRMARRKPEHGGIMAVRDPRGVFHALFSYQVEKDYRLGSCLRISDLIVARLPGGLANRTVEAAARDLARRLGCDALLIDVPAPAAAASVLSGLSELTSACFSPAWVTFMRLPA